MLEFYHEVIIIAIITDLNVSSKYRDRLLVALTRIYSNEDYLDSIKNPFLLGEALVHLGRIDEAKDVVKNRRKILSENLLSALIIYATAGLNNRLLKLIESGKQKLGFGKLIDKLELSTIYTGSNLLLEFLYNNTIKYKPKDIQLSKSELKNSSELSLAHYLSRINMLSSSPLMQFILDIVNERLTMKIPNSIKLAYLSIKTLCFSRYNKDKVSDAYNQLIKKLKKRGSHLDMFSYPIVIVNLLAAGKEEGVKLLLPKFLDALLWNIDKDVNYLLINALNYLEKPETKHNYKLYDTLYWLTERKYIAIDILVTFAIYLNDLLKIKDNINLNKIEELVSAGLILTSNMMFLRALIQTWIRQGYVDLAEEKIKAVLKETRDEFNLEEFFRILGGIYANRFSKKMRSSIEDIILAKKRKKRYLESFINELYYETMTIYPLKLKSKFLNQYLR